MFEAKKTHSGQYKRYGDSFYEWDIFTDLDEETVLNKCFKDVCKSTYPKFEEWQTNIRVGEAREYDYGYYFHGYYTLIKTEYGYHFTVCPPYTD